jgi:hypothetical protein
MALRASTFIVIIIKAFIGLPIIFICIKQENFSLILRVGDLKLKNSRNKKFI